MILTENGDDKRRRVGLYKNLFHIGYYLCNNMAVTVSFLRVADIIYLCPDSRLIWTFVYQKQQYFPEGNMTAEGKLTFILP